MQGGPAGGGGTVPGTPLPKPPSLRGLAVDPPRESLHSCPDRAHSTPGGGTAHRAVRPCALRPASPRPHPDGHPSFAFRVPRGHRASGSDRSRSLPQGDCHTCPGDTASPQPKVSQAQDGHSVGSPGHHAFGLPAPLRALQPTPHFQVQIAGCVSPASERHVRKCLLVFWPKRGKREDVWPSWRGVTEAAAAEGGEQPPSAGRTTAARPAPPRPPLGRAPPPTGECPLNVGGRRARGSCQRTEPLSFLPPAPQFQRKD